MQVILKTYVDNLGDAGDIVEVANGYATNYLIPQDLAMQATKGAVADAEALRRARVKREAADIAQAEEQASSLAGRAIQIPATAGEDGTLYGSVGKRDIADALTDRTGIVVDAKRVDLDRPIKQVGRHEVAVRLHREVSTTIIVDVIADQVMASGAEELEEALAEGLEETAPAAAAESAGEDTEDATEDTRAS